MMARGIKTIIALAFGAGLVAGQFERLPLPELFMTVAAAVGIVGLIFLVLAKPIRKMMGGVH